MRNTKKLNWNGLTEKQQELVEHIVNREVFTICNELISTSDEYIEFDNFLLNKIGYDKLSLLIQGLFLNPYAATSLREYFATGFTDFYLDANHNTLKSICPALYRKLFEAHKAEW